MRSEQRRATGVRREAWRLVGAGWRAVGEWGSLPVHRRDVRSHGAVRQAIRGAIGAIAQRHGPPRRGGLARTPPCGIRTFGESPACAHRASAAHGLVETRTFVLGAGFAIPSVMLLLLLLVLFLAIVGGGFGYSRFGYGGFSPAAIVIVILVLLALTGRL